MAKSTGISQRLYDKVFKLRYALKNSKTMDGIPNQPKFIHVLVYIMEHEQFKPKNLTRIHFTVGNQDPLSDRQIDKFMIILEHLGYITKIKSDEHDIKYDSNISKIYSMYIQEFGLLSYDILSKIVNRDKQLANKFKQFKDEEHQRYTKWLKTYHSSILSVRYDITEVQNQQYYLRDIARKGIKVGQHLLKQRNYKLSKEKFVNQYLEVTRSLIANEGYQSLYRSHEERDYIYSVNQKDEIELNTGYGYYRSEATSETPEFLKHVHFHNLNRRTATNIVDFIYQVYLDVCLTDNRGNIVDPIGSLTEAQVEKWNNFEYNYDEKYYEHQQSLLDIIDHALDVGQTIESSLQNDDSVNNIISDIDDIDKTALKTKLAASESTSDIKSLNQTNNNEKNTSYSSNSTISSSGIQKEHASDQLLDSKLRPMVDSVSTEVTSISNNIKNIASQADDSNQSSESSSESNHDN